MEANIKQKIARANKIISIKEAITKSLNAGKKPNRKFLVLEIMSKLKTSHRTANEFVRVATWEMGLDKNFNKMDAQEKLDYAE